MTRKCENPFRKCYPRLEVDVAAVSDRFTLQGVIYTAVKNVSHNYLLHLFLRLFASVVCKYRYSGNWGFKIET